MPITAPPQGEPSVPEAALRGCSLPKNLWVFPATEPTLFTSHLVGDQMQNVLCHIWPLVLPKGLEEDAWEEGFSPTLNVGFNSQKAQPPCSHSVLSQGVLGEDLLCAMALPCVGSGTGSGGRRVPAPSWRHLPPLVSWQLQ